MERSASYRACRAHRLSRSPGAGASCWLVAVLMFSIHHVAGIPPPQQLKAEVFGNLMLKMSWEPPYGWDPRTLSNSTLDQYKTYLSESTTTDFYALASLTYYQNFQYISFGLQPGFRYYFRVTSVSCCGVLRFRDVCASARSSGTTCIDSATAFHCTTTDGLETCHYPTNGYAATSVVAMAEPEAPTAVSVLVATAAGSFPGQPHLDIRWNLPNDTGTAQRQRDDVMAFKVIRSDNISFGTSKQIFYGLPTPTGDSEDTYLYQINDGDSLQAGVHYYYRIYVQNAACGPTNITCSPFVVGGRNATGLPSRPTKIVGQLLDSTRIRLDWQLPFDTGQGGGNNPSQSEPITGYRIEEDFCQPAGQCTPDGSNRRHLVTSNDSSVISFTKTGIDSAKTFLFFLQAQNGAGYGEFGSVEVVSLFFPSPPQNFTASVGGNLGPLVIFLSWEIPDNTGQGANDQVEPITEYKLYMSDSPFVYNDSNAILLQTGMKRNFTITFPQKRITPYYFMVLAANQLGYHPDNKTFSSFLSEYAVDVPTIPLNLSARVAGTRLIELTWVTPVDTGVGDNSRPLVKFVLQQSTDSDFNTIQSTFELGPLLTTYIVEVPTSGPNPFYFRIAADNEVGRSANSDSTNEQGITVPSPPTNLVATIPDERQINIRWNGPSDTGIGQLGRALVSYRVEYFAEGVATVVQYFPISITLSNYTDLDFTKNYTFRVFVQNDAGWSIPANVTQQPIVRPTAVLELLSFVQEPLKIRLMWQRPNNTGRGDHFEPITAYVVEMDSNVIFGGAADFASFTETARGTGFCVDVNCMLDVSFLAARKDPYWFRVYALNQLGAGPFSFTNEQSVQVPSAPTGLTVVVIAPRTLFLQWVQPSDTGVGGSVRALGNYTLQQSYGDSTFPEGATLVNRSYSNTTFNDSILLPSSGPTYFFFRVMTYNDAGDSGISTVVQEQGVELPSAPILLRTKITSPLEIIFFWNMSADTGVTGQSRPLDAYILQVAEEPAYAASSTFGSLFYSNNNASTENQAKFLSKIYSGLAKGKTYFFRVAAKNIAGTGPFATAVSNDAISVPSSPIAFQAAVRSSFQIDLQWEVPLDNGFYENSMSKIIRLELEQSTDPTFKSGVSANLIASQPFAFIFNFSTPIFTKGQGHHFRVWAVNVAGRSLYPTNVSEQAIDVPSAPTALSITITNELELTVEWSIPLDTGLGPSVTPIRPLHEYTLQVFITNTPPPGSICSWPHSCSWQGYQDIAPNHSYTVSNITSSYVMSGLIKGKSYFTRVLARNDAGAGNISEAVNKPALEKPNAAIVLSAIADRPLVINLTWDLSTDTGLGAEIRPQWPMGQQRIEVATDAAFTANVFRIMIAPNFTNYAIEGLDKGKHYYIRMFSSNVLGESVSSNVKTQHALSVPSIPLNLRVVVSTVRIRELELTWDFPIDTGLGGATCYIDCLAGERQLTRLRLQRVDTNNPTDDIVAGTPQADPVGYVDFTGHDSFFFYPSSDTWATDHFLPLAYNDTDLLKGQTYYYAVFVSNSVGESNASAPKYEMAMEKPSPARSLSVVISGELSLNTSWLAPLDNGDGAVASLSSPRPFHKYIVQVDDVSPAFLDINFEFDVAFPVAQYRALAPTLVQGRMYYFRVVVLNVAGFSNVSNQVNQTAILKPTPPIVTASSPQVTNPAEITFTWYRPLDTGAIGQYWPLFYFELQMSLRGDLSFNSSNVTELFKAETIGIPQSPGGVATSVNDISIYVFVVTGLTVGETYHFRVFTENEAGKSSSSVVATKIAVKLPTPPANFTVTAPAPLTIQIKFYTPEDTGAGGRLLPVDRYILEFEVGDILTEKATNFSLSPFAFDGCFSKKTPPCALTGNSPYDLGLGASSGIVYTTFCNGVWDYDVHREGWEPIINEGKYPKCTEYYRNFDALKEEWTVLVTGLTKARTYYFRALALNEAGLSLSTPILMEYGVDLPSEPLGPIGFSANNARLDIIGVLQYRISFSLPLDTGLGDQRRPLVSYGLQLQTVDDESLLTWPPSSTMAYVGGNEVFGDLLNGVNNVTIYAGVRYFARAFAVNSAGAGPASGFDTNGPSFDFFEPKVGDCAGGSTVFVYGSKMGDISTTYQMFLGDQECLSVFPASFQRSVGCVVPPGVPGKRGFRLFVDGLLLRKDSVFEYLGPQVQRVDPSDGVSVDGGVRVTVGGKNFGTTLASQEIAITSKRSDRCKESTWTSDSSMLCITAPVAYGAQTNSSVIVRINEIPSIPGAKGSTLLYDVPPHYECSRDVDSDCYACGFPKCYEQELSRAQSLLSYPIAVGEVTEVCEEAVMTYCGYGDSTTGLATVEDL